MQMCKNPQRVICQESFSPSFLPPLPVSLLLSHFLIRTLFFIPDTSIWSPREINISERNSMLSLEEKFPKSSIMLYRNSEWWEAFPTKFKTILSGMPIKILVGLGVVVEATSGHFRTQRKCSKQTSK